MSIRREYGGRLKLFRSSRRSAVLLVLPKRSGISVCTMSLQQRAFSSATSCTAFSSARKSSRETSASACRTTITQKDGREGERLNSAKLLIVTFLRRFSGSSLSRVACSSGSFSQPRIRMNWRGSVLLSVPPAPRRFGTSERRLIVRRTTLLIAPAIPFLRRSWLMSMMRGPLLWRSSRSRGSMFFRSSAKLRPSADSGVRSLLRDAVRSGRYFPQARFRLVSRESASPPRTTAEW